MQALTDLVETALKGLPSQYQGKPHMEAIVHTIAAQVQGIEDDRAALAHAAELANATGKWLENLERLVQMPAASRAFTDAERRAIVAAQGVINSSHGAALDLRRALEALGLRWGMDPWRQGWMRVEGPTPSFPPIDLVYDLLKAATAAGCGLQILIDAGVLLEDQSLRELGTTAWTVTGDGVVSKPSPGVLRFEGKQGAVIEGSMETEVGAAMTLSGEYRGTLPLELGLAGGSGIYGAPVGPSDTWLPWSVDFVVGTSAGAPSTPTDVTGWFELRNLRLAPTGRADRTLRGAWSGDGHHVADANGGAWSGDAAVDLLGGLGSYLMQS